MTFRSFSKFAPKEMHCVEGHCKDIGFQLTSQLENEELEVSRLGPQDFKKIYNTVIIIIIMCVLFYSYSSRHSLANLKSLAPALCWSKDSRPLSMLGVTDTYQIVN